MTQTASISSLNKKSFLKKTFKNLGKDSTKKIASINTQTKSESSKAEIAEDS